MKYLLIIIALLVTSCTGPTGPEGPMGPDGKDGAPLETIILEGTLDNNGDSTQSWEIDLPDTITFTMISCYVRKVRSGHEYMWQIPNKWYFNEEFVRIIDDEDIAPGDEYKITLQ